jgi:predicted nucleotidyltransferase
MSASHQAVLNRILQELRRMPEVNAIAAYGSTATQRWSPESDLDLIVILAGDAPVNSVHFFVDGIPVDLNLKSRENWIKGGLGWLPPDGLESLWDPEYLFEDVPEPPSSSHDVEQYRYAQRHGLLKLQRWIREDSDVADLLAAGATHWIAVSYFHARGMRFPGIDNAVPYWRDHDPKMIELLIGAVKEQDDRLGRIEQASEIALSPVGGLWNTGEVHITGWNGPPTVDEVERIKQLLCPVLSLQ